MQKWSYLNRNLFSKHSGSLKSGLNFSKREKLCVVRDCLWADKNPWLGEWTFLSVAISASATISKSLLMNWRTGYALEEISEENSSNGHRSQTTGRNLFPLGDVNEALAELSWGLADVANWHNVTANTEVMCFLWNWRSTASLSCANSQQQKKQCNYSVLKKSKI